VTAWEHHVPLAFHSGREADHSPPSRAEVKEWVELYLHSPMRLHGMVLSSGEHRDNFTFFKLDLVAVYHGVGSEPTTEYTYLSR
jgi:hypothetical protein